MNFYQEFQEDDTIPTPMSGFSNKASFLGPSPIINKKENAPKATVGNDVKVVNIQING